jgi:hypothetical protein
VGGRFLEAGGALPIQLFEAIGNSLVADCQSTASPFGPLFATTYNERMKKTLGKAGFVKKGQEWKGRKHMLSLWLKE